MTRRDDRARWTVFEAVVRMKRPRSLGGMVLNILVLALGLLTRCRFVIAIVAPGEAVGRTLHALA
jgi:hypothetical protein